MMKPTPPWITVPLLAGLLLLGQTPAHADTASLNYDDYGNITSRTTSQGTTTYTYDELDRIKAEAGPAKTQSLTYDADSNRLSDGSASYTYDPNSNKLVTRTAGSITTVTTDPTGRITADGTGRTYTYTDAGQLSTLSKNGVLMATYTYNAQNQRTRKVTTASAPQGAQTILYEYDEHSHLIAEMTGTGSPLRTYLWRDDTPVAQVEEQSNKIIYYQTDHLNTPRAAMDETGKTVWRWESDAFGSTAANEDPDADNVKTTVNLRFPGQYYDQESGLHYNYHRYYIPELGRYLTSDPIGLAGGINTFGYVGGNPVSKVDPFGLAEMCYRPVQGPIPGQHCFARFNGDDGDTSSFDPTGVGPDPKPKGATCEKAKGPEDDDCVKREMKKCQSYHFTKNNCCHCVEQALKACGQSIPTNKWPNWPINPGPQPGELGRKP